MTRNLIIWPLALVLAVFVFLITAPAVISLSNSAIASKFWPTNGLALAAETDQILVRKATKTPSAQPGPFSKAELNIARRAFALEPTAFSAVRLLALQSAATGNEAKAFTLMTRVVDLTRRDNVANLWFVDYYGRRNDLDQVLRYYDINLRTKEALAPVLLRQVSIALENDAFLPPLLKMMRTRPVWERQFWYAAMQNPAALNNLVKLRIDLARSGIPDVAKTDSEMFLELAKAQNFASAEQLYAALTPRKSASDIVRDADFKAEPKFAPLDWQLNNSGDFGATIDPRAGKLQVSAVSNSGGWVARQIVRLSPGRYVIEAKSQALYEAAPAPKLQLVCAEVQGEGNVALNEFVPLGTARIMFTQPSGGCGYYWMIVSATVAEDAGYDLAFDKISIRPL
ncbi:MAG: hypothetical protein U5J78_06265 [Parasphingorhabdus sp.]|nr:hypothetical protein [Parasphingorhabdus sp.]